MYQNDVVEQLLRRFNPFGLRAKNGSPLEFLQVSESYLYVFKRLYHLFPRGYIEIPFLISGLYHHLSFAECKSCATALEPMGVCSPTLIIWKSEEGKAQLENICKGLHFLCETTFDNVSFLEAYGLFLNYIEIERVKNENRNRYNKS